MFRQYRLFFVILVFVSLVWLVMDMSTVRSYRTTVRVVYTGIDTARYSVVSEDRELPLTVESDGFSALLHHWSWGRNALSVDMSGKLKNARHVAEIRLSVPSGDYREWIQSHFSHLKNCSVSFDMDSLSVTLCERKCRAYAPQLRNVSFVFSDGYGLSGTPNLYPDTIYLYGSEKSLSDVNELYTNASSVDVSDSGGVYQLDLVPVWNEYPDLRVSRSTVKLTVPVEAYVEERRLVNVRFLSNDTTIRVRLYPDQVAVTVWVPQGHSFEDGLSDMKAVVRHDQSSGQTELPISITDFPSDVRIKSVVPDRIQYVIIK